MDRMNALGPTRVAENVFQWIQIRAVCWPEMINSLADDSTFKFVIQES